MELRPFRWREGVQSADLEPMREVLNSSGFFFDFEVGVALELARDSSELGQASEYRFLIAEDEAGVVGFTGYGAIACTRSSFDVYWIAVHERARGKGLGTELMARTEGLIAASQGTRIYVETSGRPQYDPTRKFYEKLGYTQAAILPDYYAPGDDKIVLCKLLLA